MILNFAFDFLSKNIRRSLLSVFLIVVSTLVIMLSVILSENRDEVYETIDTLLVCGVDCTAELDIDYGDNMGLEQLKEMQLKISEFLDDVSEEAEINCIGSYSTGGYLPIPELYEIQKKGGGTFDEYLNMTSIHKNATDMFKIEITSGTHPSEMKFESDTDYLYLGSGYKDFINPGTEYEVNGYKFKVAGILDESQIFFDDNFTSGISATSYSVTHDMKYEILCFSDYHTSRFLLCANKGYNINQAIEKLYSVAEKYDMQDYILYTTLNDKYEMANQEWLFIKNILYKLITIVCISCILMLICTHILDLLSQMRNYGIMYANGFSISDISKIITIKNIAVSVFAFLISIIICLLAVNLVFKGSEDMSDVFNRIIVHIAIPLSLSVIGLITVFITLFSIVILRKLSPLRMIGGQND